MTSRWHPPGNQRPLRIRHIAAYRSPLRRYCARVISVHGMVLSLESLQIRRNHSLLESLTAFSVRLSG
jgi:hypothetical protein